LQIEWYAANPCFHPIPAGYGLPWGTPEEIEIPGPLVFEAEYELAKAQLATQTPCPPALPPGGLTEPPRAVPDDAAGEPGIPDEASAGQGPSPVERTAYEAVPGGDPLAASDTIPPGVPGFPPDWPDPSGFVPPPPVARPPTCRPSIQPVLKHTQAYNGHDSEFTEALASYYHFQDDARFGGWQSYLDRSEDFVRFCCRMHLWEMLSARGGAGETRVVWRWPMNR